MDPLTPPLPIQARLDASRDLDARSTRAVLEPLHAQVRVVADEARERLRTRGGSAREAMRT